MVTAVMTTTQIDSDSLLLHIMGLWDGGAGREGGDTGGLRGRGGGETDGGGGDGGGDSPGLVST